MKRLLLAALLCGAPLPVCAQSAAPMAYKTASGQYQASVATTPVASGAPTIGAYKGTDGQWHAPLVTVSLCSVDANGYPLLCSSGGMTQAQADARYLQQSGGTMTGVIGWNTSNNTVSVLKMQDSSGDELDVSAQIGLFGTNGLVLNGTNHSPTLYMTASYIGSNVPVLSIGPDSTGAISGSAVIVPTGAELQGGFSVPAGVPTVTLDAASAPASSAACTAGQTEFVGAYEYRCIKSGQWGRIALQTGY